MPTLRETFYQDCMGYLDFRAIKAGKVKQSFFMLDDDKGIKAFIHQYSRDHDMYFGVATRDAAGGKKENIVEIPGLWCDIDFKDIERQEYDRRMDSFPHKPTVIVETGGGLHLYWIFREPSNQDEMTQCEAALRGITMFLGGDLQAAEAARVLRIPGTKNYKYKPPRQVILKYHNGSRYNLSDFEDFISQSSPSPTYSMSVNSAIDAIMTCKFMAHCSENRETLSEPMWYAMITNLMKEPGGVARIHELSRKHPGYTKDETDAKILHAINSSGPMTCAKIYDKTGFLCDSACGVLSPAALSFRQLNVETTATTATSSTTATGCNKLQQTHNFLQQTATMASGATLQSNYLEIFKMWLETCDGEFKMQDAARELGWHENRSHYTNFRSAVFRSCELGLITRASRARGVYRKKERAFKELDILEAPIEEFPIVLPFGINKLVEINPREIILVAGETNAGKTGIIFNIMWSNIFALEKTGKLKHKGTEDSNKIGIRYFSSEMGPSAIRKKLLNFGPVYPVSKFAQVVSIPDRTVGFQDILDPTGINCIDYLEPPNGEYFMMAPIITEIFNNLDTGVAIIGIQKASSKEFARGGEATLEKPRLAINLTYNKERHYFTAKITKGKAYKDRDVYGLELDFALEKGVKIIQLSDWGYPDQHKKRRSTLNLRGDAQEMPTWHEE